MDNFKWVSLPARDSKPMIKVIAVLGFLLMLLVGYVELSWVGLFIAFFVSIIVFLQFVFPTTFTINENALIVEYLFSKKEYDFARIKSYYPDNAGVLLSPFINPSRLENFRGIYVRYGREDKEKIVGMIKERVKV